MRYRIGVVALAAVTLAWSPGRGHALAGGDGHAGLTGPAGPLAAPRAQEKWEWQGRIERGKAIEIKGINGEIHAEPASGNQVEVVAYKRGRKSDPASVDVVAVEHQGGVTICAVYPSKPGERPNECAPGGRGRMNVEKNDVKVEFTVRVPDGVAFFGRTVNGGVDAHGISADVRAHTVNGDIDLSATGLAEATTVNGSITVSMGKADWSGTLDFSTVNGSVTLEMPENLNADVSIQTVNGHISSDYPLTVEGRFSPRHLKGKIGDGGRTLVVKTVNGSVQLRRS